MLRTTVFCLMAAAVPGLALAEPARTQFPQSAIGAEVHGVDGTVIGRVTAVERDAQGNIIAVEAPGLEPEDAPNSLRDYVASNEERSVARLLVSDRQDRDRPASANRTRTR